MEAIIELATNGYIVRFPDGEVYTHNDFREVCDEIFGYLEDALDDNVTIKIKCDYKPIKILTYEERDPAQ